MSSLRVFFFVLGLFLLTISIVNFIYLQVGVGPERIHGFLSGPTATPPPPVPTNAAGVPTSTETAGVIPGTTETPTIQPPVTEEPPPTEPPVTDEPVATEQPPTEEPAIVEPTVEVIDEHGGEIPMATPVPVPGPTPTPTLVESQPRLWFRGTPVAPLGTHVLQPHEYLFCIGRAYGVLPQAIAEVNFLALDAVLFDGQQLQIPDVPWVKIPPGQICTPQFKSPYSPTSVSMITIPPSLVPGSREFLADPGREDGSVSGELRLINFVLPKERVKKVGSQLGSLAVTLTPVLTWETRIVRVDLPDEMFLGASGVVKLTFSPDPRSQTGELGPTSPGQTNATATSTPEPEEWTPYSRPLVIPDVFDNCYITATAHLDAVGFSYSPLQDNMQPVNKGEPIIWYWSIKPQEAQQQKLIISLRLQFEPKSDIESKCNNGPPPRDGQIWADSFTVNVRKALFDLYTGYVAAVLGIISTALPILQLMFSPRSK